MRVRAAAAGLSTTIGVAALVGVGLAPAEAALNTSCRGTAGAVTVPGNLFVPAGQSCDLTGTTINGNVTVRAGATLLLDGATVNGGVVVQADGYVEATATTVSGTTRLNQSFGAYVEGSTLTGAVTSATGGFFYGATSELGGDLRSTAGETVLETVRVVGGVRASGDSLTDLYDSTVNGDVLVDAAGAGSAVCSSEVDGRLTIRGSQDVVSIGDDVVGECGPTYVGGDLVLRDNVGGVHLTDTIVRGGTACAGNDPAPVGSGNRFRGGATGQCAELAPAADPAAQARTAQAAPEASTQADRTAAVVERAAARSAAGTAAAAAVGSAGLGG